MKQIIIVRKDLNMSKGKMSAQVAHASMAFLINLLKNNIETKEVLDCEIGIARTERIVPFTFTQKKEIMIHHYKRSDLEKWAEETIKRGENYFYYEPVNPENPNGELRLCEKKSHIEYKCEFSLDAKLYEDWICGSFTKIILEAKNKHQLEKVYTIANELGLKEGVDYFPIKDNCYTELEPEEIDEDGIGRTLTCVGFIPLNDEIVNKISKKYQLYHDENKKNIDPWDGEKPHAKNGFVEKYCL